MNGRRRTSCLWHANLLLAAATIAFTACASTDSEPQDPAQRVQAHSLLGQPLRALPIAAAERPALEQRLLEAQAQLALDPHAELAHVWLGRRLSALNRFDEAVDAFTRGLEDHEDSYRLLRFRGHRFITLRKFDRAENDLAEAALLVRGRPDEDEPNTNPDPAKSYPSTVQHQIHYHLALARYLRGDFARAASAWSDCLRTAGASPDSLCGATNWYCATLLRLGRAEDARALLESIRADLPAREGGGYLRLCLLYKGELAPEALIPADEASAVNLATLNYGLGNYWLVKGDTTRARAAFVEAASSSAWMAFGRIAAEVELAR
jgi:tetratricopeptide (TPR) repeat protein